MNFIVSPRADQIFYADAFVIEGRGCLVMGHGKTEMCRLATDKVRDVEIGPDHICLIREGDCLYAQFEMIQTCDAYVPTPHPVHHMIRCLSDAETARAFGPGPRSLSLTDYDEFVRLCHFNITYNPDLLGALRSEMGPVRYGEFASPARRVERFRALTSGVPGMRFIVVPWMDSVEEKAKMLREYLRAA
jgi:hypothetical protein